MSAVKERLSRLCARRSNDGPPSQRGSSDDAANIDGCADIDIEFHHVHRQVARVRYVSAVTRARLAPAREAKERLETRCAGWSRATLCNLSACEPRLCGSIHRNFHTLKHTKYLRLAREKSLLHKQKKKSNTRTLWLNYRHITTLLTLITQTKMTEERLT